MKKLISFAVAVLMLVTLAVPMTYAADHTVAGTASDVGSVVGLTVDEVAVTSSEDYIAKMGYADEGSGWAAITTVDGLKNAVGGNYYIANNLVFTEADNVCQPDQTYICKAIAADTTIDGCGFTVTGIEMTDVKAMLWYVAGSITFNLKNLSVGTESSMVTFHAGSNVGFSALGNVDGKSYVNNVCVWADFTTTGDGQVGGFYGYGGNNSWIEITNSEMNGTISGTGATNAAGFVAYNKGQTKLTNCVNNADITVTYTGTATPIVAGFYVLHRSWTGLTNCVNNGDITLVSDTGGGLAGFAVMQSGYQKAFNCKFTNCVNNGNVIQIGNGTFTDGVAGIATFGTIDKNRTFTFENCVNNGTVAGYSSVGGIGATNANYHNRKVFNSCVNNGTVIANGGSAHGIYAALYAFQEMNNMGSCTDTGMVTQLVDGVKTTVVNSGVNEPKAFIQMTSGSEINDVRFILAMNEAEYEAAKNDLEFTVAFKLADGTVKARTMDVIVAFKQLTSNETTDVVNAADGVVLCGVIVTDVPADAWTNCSISYNGNAWTYAK